MQFTNVKKAPIIENQKIVHFQTTIILKSPQLILR